MTSRFEGSLRAGSAGERIIDFHVEPLRGLDGEVVYVIGTGIDVTERVRGE